LGVETDTGYAKVGDGDTEWADLAYGNLNPAPLAATLQNYVEWLNDCTAQPGVPDNGWTLVQTAAGMANTLAVDDYTGINAWGAIKINLRTGATNKYYVFTGSIISQATLTSGVLGQGEMRVKTRFGVMALSDVTNTFIIRSGIQSHTQQEPDNGCFFRYAYNVNGGRWQAVTRAATVETAQDTGVTVTASATAMSTFEVVVNDDGTSAAFYIDGVLTNTITTNIPVLPTQTIGGCWSIIRSAGTADGIYAALLDYFYYRRAFSTPRP